MTRADFRARIEPHPGVATWVDRARQATVVVAAAALVAAAVGPISRGLRDETFATDGSFLGMAFPGQLLWLLVGAGFVGYAIWQLLPLHAAEPRQRGVGWWVAAVMALKAVWLSTPWPAAVAFLLLIVGIILYVRVVRSALPRSPWTELALVDGVVGLSLGWAIFASLSTLAAFLTFLQPQFWIAYAPTWGVVFVILGAVGCFAASAFAHWRVTPALAGAWALVWIMVGRLEGQPYSVAVGLTAGICAGILAVTPVLLRIVIALRPNVD